MPGFYDPLLPVEVRDLVIANTHQLSTVARLVNSIGNFTIADTDYNSWLYQDNGSPFLGIRLPNLRDIVELLSDRPLPSRRERFHTANPIPGAEWDEHRLLNPDDIMPLEYGVAQMRADLLALKDLLSHIRRKHPDLVASVNLDGKGSPATLVSCEVQLRGMHDADSEPDLGEQLFWTGEHLPPATFWIGVITLTGEVPVQRAEWSTIRSRPTSRSTGYASWSNAVQLTTGL